MAQQAAGKAHREGISLAELFRMFPGDDAAQAWLDATAGRRAVVFALRLLQRAAQQASGIESFWSMLKRAHKGIDPKMSPKHLDRYIQEFAGRHNIRDIDTLTSDGDGGPRSRR